VYINEQKIVECIKTLIIGYKIQGKLLFDSCYIQQKQNINKRNIQTFKELIKNFGTDCTRLYAVNPNIDIIQHEQFINKLRNASRFVNQHLYEKK
jgi:hypothetical protein